MGLMLAVNQLHLVTSFFVCVFSPFHQVSSTVKKGETLDGSSKNYSAE